jgi:hypothetical protein
MAVSIMQIVRRRGALVALIAALVVGGWTIASAYLLGLVWAIPTPRAGETILTTALPLAAGVFLSLWLLAPVAAELRLFHIIMRSILAVGIGSTLVFVVSALTATIALLVDQDSDRIPLALGLALQSALSTLISALPLGILAGVLAWVWLTARPPKHQVSGMLDEV